MNKKRSRRMLECILFVLCLDLLLFCRIWEEKNLVEKKAVMALPIVSEEVREKKKIALTFDDGPHPVYTKQLLEILEEKNIKVTFFVMGEKAESYPDLIKTMEEEGHLIGNHTYTHLQLQAGCEEQFKEELQKTSCIIEEITGQGTEFVRPPFGTWDKRFENELNMFPVLWNIDPLDWCSSDVGGIVQKVVSKANDGAIILMHDQYKSTIAATLEIITQLESSGYEFVTVEEILLD